MVDTIRTIGELNALLADNTTGNISAQDLRDVLVSMNVHAEIGAANLSEVVGTVFAKVPLNVAGAFERGFVADTVGNRISSTPVALKALVDVEMQITALQAGRTIDLAVFVAGSEVMRSRRPFDAVGHYTWGLGVQLVQGDDVDLRVRADQAATSVDVAFALLRARRVGIE